MPLLDTMTVFKVCRVTMWGIGCCPVRHCLVGSPSGLDDNLCGQSHEEQLPHSNIAHRNRLTAWIFAVCFLFLPLRNLLLDVCVLVESLKVVRLVLFWQDKRRICIGSCLIFFD